jgi:sulfur-carrier protein adenylyltransferase/sulfurtransferase
MELTEQQIERYSRHIILQDVGGKGQLKLGNAKVLLIGAGGLGSPAGLYLAAAGIGTIGLVDGDVVDLSNLQRQILHTTATVGQPKVESGKRTLNAINPEITVETYHQLVDAENILSLIGPYDVILDGSDNFSTRFLVNDACFFAKKTLVSASMFRFEGQLTTIKPHQGFPCYRCLYPEPPPPGMVPSCAEGGVLGVLCASVGATQVTEAIKLLTGIGDPLIGRLQIYDALEMSWRQLNVRKDPQCAVCGENPTVTELIDYDEFCGAITDEAAEAVAGHTVDVKQLEQWLTERESGRKDFVLIDVREKVERDINQIPGSILIPKGDFQTGAALGDLPQDKQVVLYCKTGVRSAEVLALVHGAGLADAVHVGGGVSAWVRQIDPSQPAY